MAERDANQSESRSTPGNYWTTITEWFLLRGNRALIAVALAAGFLVVFVVLETFGVVPLENTQALFYVYSGLISGNLTLVTVVVSINQLFLSRELQTPGELRDQIEAVADYRSAVEDAAGRIAPVTPLGFLQLLVEATREDAQRLGGFTMGEVPPGSDQELDDVITTLTEQMDRIDELLTESDTGTFNVLSVMVETNYAEQINRLRAVQTEHGDEMDRAVHESIDALVDRLQDIDVARQYFKSIYLQQELSSLSRMLLYTGLPAVAAAIATLLWLTVPPSEPPPVFEIQVLLPVSLVIALFPLALLSAYFVRTATVTKRTAATLPFTTPEQEQL